MDSWKSGLIIHGKKFNAKELLTFCSDNIVSAVTNPWEKEIYRFIITWLSDSDHIIQFSSGTTGKPKEIRLAKKSMMASAMNTCRYFSLNRGSTALLCMPIDYIAGKMMIIRSFVCDMDLYVTEPRGLPNLEGLPSIDFCAMVPMQVINLLACEKDITPLRKLIIGGAEISHELENLASQVTGTEIYATYGMAETSSHIALRRLNGHEPEESYTAMPEISLTRDSRGCLTIQAAYLPEKVQSNDLVEFTGPRSFKWLGRFDNLINSGGIKIVPEEVESLIMSKTMLECVVLGLPDKNLGQKLVFVFETEQIPDSFPTLKTDLAGILPRRWKPKELITVDKFPRNEAFKVDRQKLAENLYT